MVSLQTYLSEDQTGENLTVQDPDILVGMATLSKFCDGLSSVHTCEWLATIMEEKHF